MALIWVDWGIIAILALSALLGLARGLVREAFALATWVVGAWVAWTFAEFLAPHLAPYIQVPSLRHFAAIALLFLLTLIVGAMVGFLVAQLVRVSGLGSTDRLLGLVFGAVRGTFMVSILVLLASLTPLAQDPWWAESRLLPPFERLAVWLRGQFPADFSFTPSPSLTGNQGS